MSFETDNLPFFARIPPPILLPSSFNEERRPTPVAFPHSRAIYTCVSLLGDGIYRFVSRGFRPPSINPAEFRHSPVYFRSAAGYPRRIFFSPLSLSRVRKRPGPIVESCAGEQKTLIIAAFSRARNVSLGFAPPTLVTPNDKTASTTLLSSLLSLFLFYGYIQRGKCEKRRKSVCYKMEKCLFGATRRFSWDSLI